MMEFVVPCLFGLEGLCAGELRRLGMENVRAENGRVRFSGGFAELARANMCLRFGERVLLLMAEFDAVSFDALFEGTRAAPWEEFIPRDGAFPVKGHCLDSQLHSVPDCQKIVKKAVVERLKQICGVSWFAETGPVFQIQFSIMRDRACLFLDTSGPGLHKRGYRPGRLAAPLRETLAAAMVDLARYRGRGELCDPFCGSGTIAVEAAMIAKNRAPGLDRAFSAMKWPAVPRGVWHSEREAAVGREFHGEYVIRGSDIDPAMVESARGYAARARVDDCVRFETADARQFSRSTGRGVIVTNPPYGERLLDRRGAEALYRDFGAALSRTSGWQLFCISSHPEFEHFFGRRADKRRKLYNGMIKCELFMYL